MREEVPHRSLLGHLAWHLSEKPETVATEALAYILASSLDMTEALLGDLRTCAELDSFEPLPAMAERTIASGARPDVTILDHCRRNRVFIENKFWAHLTERQPEDYLEGLAADASSVLLFVVPEPRVRPLWTEIQARCASQGIELEEEGGSSCMTAAGVAGEKKSLVITSWANILDRLLGAAEGSERALVAEDVRQLRGLTDRMAQSAFLPLRDEEVRQPFGCRSPEDYLPLVSAIVRKLDESERGSTDGLAWGGRLDPWKGHYVQVDGFGLCIGVLKTSGRAPLWCRLYPEEWSRIGKEHIPNLEREFGNGAMTKDYEFFIPIRLEANVENARLVENAVAQVLDFAKRIGQTIGFPPRP